MATLIPEPAGVHLREDVIRERIEASQPPRPNLRDVLMARAKARERVDVTAD
jgi:hypothetical protein